MEQKIIDLESKFSFQEDLLQQLNSEVVQQRREIEALSLQLRTVREQLSELMAEDGRPLPEAPLDEKPPHY
jgi:SlyX protein